MRKTFEFDDSQNHYMGICNSCGEVYEADSVVEDLEGLTFDCRKDFCEGVVGMSLCLSHEASSLFAISDFSKDEIDPKRFC